MTRCCGSAITLVCLAAAAGCDKPASPGDVLAAGISADTVPLFVPVTAGRIAHDGGASRGVGWADFDDDGDPDLVVSNTAGQWNAFYLNPGSSEPESSRFQKISDPNASPTGGVAAARGRAEGVSWVDYDGDGDLDLHIVTRGQEPDLVFQNDGNGQLGRVTDSPLIRTAGSSMACWADVDADGWLDVFLVAYGDEQTNTLLRNTGPGGFEEIPSGPGAAGSGTGRACAWGIPTTTDSPTCTWATLASPTSCTGMPADLRQPERPRDSLWAG